MVLKAVSVSSGSGGGVTSLNGVTGAADITSTGGTITITEVGNNINLESNATGGGTVTSVSVVNANGVSAAVANPTTTPAQTFTLGAITPSTVAATGGVSGSGAAFASLAAGGIVQAASGSGVLSIASANLITRAIGITIDGGGSVITTGNKGYIYVPYGCTITAATMVADQSGSAVVDIWAAVYPTVPTVSNTITASDLPTLSSSQVSQDTTLTGWTKTIAAGSVIGFNVNSAATVTRVNLTLTVQTT